MARNKKKRQSYKKSLKFDFRSAAVEKSDGKMLLFETHDGKYSPDKKPENYLINVVDDEDDSEAKVIRISIFCESSKPLTIFNWLLKFYPIYSPHRQFFM
jgi:hypothetical protein